MSECTAIPVRDVPLIDMRRSTGLEHAVPMLGGQQPLADALGIHVRSLRDKLMTRRGITRLEIVLTAREVEARANAMLDHVRKLREIVA